VGCSPSGTDCSSMNPTQNHKSCQQTCSSVGSSPHGSTGHARILLQQGLPIVSQPPSGTSTCSSVGSSMVCSWIYAPSQTFVGFRGTACLIMVFSMGCKGISALVSGPHPPPPSSLTLLSAEIFLSHILTPLSQSPSPCRFYFPFLNMLSQRHYHHH